MNDKEGYLKLKLHYIEYEAIFNNRVIAAWENATGKDFMSWALGMLEAKDKVDQDAIKAQMNNESFSSFTLYKRLAEVCSRDDAYHLFKLGIDEHSKGHSSAEIQDAVIRDSVDQDGALIYDAEVTPYTFNALNVATFCLIGSKKKRT